MLNKTLTQDEETLFDQTEAKIHACHKCRLSETRTKAVPGAGSRTADIMFVGEGPGKNEDLAGLPFVGAAGKFLDELLESISLKRGDVYIANIVKCRPPGNRDPMPDEVKACLPYLRTQTRIIKPKVICTLGSPAAKSLVDPDITISRVHGTLRKKKGIYFFMLYHPAAALYNGKLKDVLRADFIKLREFLTKELSMEESMQ